MRVNLDHAITLVLDSEGGFTNDPRDAGGATCRGCTQATIAGWRGRAVSVDEVRALTEEEARAIYEAQYADRISFDALPVGLSYAVLDTAVNSGVSRAGKLLQQALRFPVVDQDGIIGVRTLAAVAERPVSALIRAYAAARQRFLESLTAFATYGRGWTSRVERVLDDALSLAQGSAPLEVRLPLDEGAQVKTLGVPVKLTATKSGWTAITTLGTVLTAAGAAATDASGVLAPYADIHAVRYVLVALAVVSASASMVVAMQRMRSGATT